MKLADFNYDLPAGRIAQEPAQPRDHSRLLIINAKDGALAHKRFSAIADTLYPGDALVLNATKVFPARLRGRKKSGGKIELLFLAPTTQENSWKALVRGVTSATDLEFAENLCGRMTRRLDEGEWEISFSGANVRDVLSRQGEMPLPPYIKRPQPRAADLDRYQTVYAHQEGAVAAPTAGFHFTPELLERLRQKGIHILEIVLHVGWGTFRPVRSETVEEHQMLAEHYEVNAETATALERVRANGQRIVAVGTTAVRTLESIIGDNGRFLAGSGETNLFIYPGYHFKAVDALITNFHLPDSTPLLLANAFHAFTIGRGGDRERGSNAVSPPRPLAPSPTPPFTLRFAYEAAIREGYRFYSYGDAMFIA